MINVTVANKPIIIYGVGKTSYVLAQYLKSEGYNILAFTVESAFYNESTFIGLPVIRFEEIENNHSMNEVEFFVAIGYQNMNSERERIFNECKNKGYQLATFIHSSVTLFDDVKVGAGTVILDHVSIQPGVAIAENTYVWSNAIIAHGTNVGDNCWITAGSTIAGDATIENNCFLGINCTIGHNVTLGELTFVGANTLVAKDTAANTTIISKEGEKLRLTSQQFMKFAKI